MFKRLETLVAACLYYSGLVKLARFWIQRSGRKLVILCYHRASGGHLRRQLLCLKRHYRILHLESALEELYKPSQSESQRGDRRTLLAVTFDDGYHDNYTDAFAFARELQIPITVFLVPTPIESGRAFAWLAGEDSHLVPYTQVNEAKIEDHTYLLNKADEREKLAQIISNRVRYTTSIVKREAFLASVRKALAIPSSLTEGEKTDLSLTWSEVKEMEKSGWVSFGAHTMHHPMLTCLTDPCEVDYEVSESRVVLEKKLGHPVRTFAYPYGEFGERGLRAARAAKYDGAVTTIYGFNTLQTDPHLLYRIVVDVHQHWLVVAAKASGIWEFFLRPYLVLVHLLKNIFGRKSAAV
jgi:peptidoglycan/xylan/chitin deacetylase (PgdA/CDA1 family)